MSELEKWVIMINSADRPGVMTSVASVFSGRGLQVEAIMGYGGGSGEACLTVVFVALESRKEIMHKLTERLENVHNAEAFSYDSESLIKTVTVKMKEGILPAGFTPVNGLANTYIGSGKTSEIDAILSESQANIIELAWHLTKLR